MSAGDRAEDLESTVPVLRVSQLRKRYGHVEALSGASLEVRRGEVVALVGDNGAGKSTLVKAVAGVHEPDSGSIFVDERERRFRRPSDARAAGIEIVYQDLALAPDLSVWANMFLGREVLRGGVLRMIGWLNKAHMRTATQQYLDELHIEIKSGEQCVEELSGGQRQAVAVARGVTWAQKLVILDEPTNNLGVPEQRKVLSLIRTLRERNIGVLLISHNLEQVFEVADRVVVLRQGANVFEAGVQQTSPTEVISWITGVQELA